MVASSDIPINIPLSIVALQKFEAALIQARREELRIIAQQATVSNNSDSIILEQHFADRLPQPKNKLPGIGKKEAGYSTGYIGEYTYIDNTKATFIVKSALNKALNAEDKAKLIENFGQSYVASTVRQLKANGNYSAAAEARVKAEWSQNVKPYILPDDLNMSDFIREYIAGGLYRLTLQQQSPLIELVPANNQLAAAEDRVYLRSKFLPNFETFLSAQVKSKNLANVQGLEKVIARALLLGEADLSNYENFGVIEKDGERIFAKIDHGKSFCTMPHSLTAFKETLFNRLLEQQQPLSLVKLHQELEGGIQFFSQNRELINSIIEQRVHNLEKTLAPNIKFSMLRMSLASSDAKQPLVLETFTFQTVKNELGKEEKHLISDKGNSLSSYFKTAIEESLQKTPREFSLPKLKAWAATLGPLIERHLKAINKEQNGLTNKFNKLILAPVVSSVERISKTLKAVKEQPMEKEKVKIAPFIGKSTLTKVNFLLSKISDAARPQLSHYNDLTLQKEMYTKMREDCVQLLQLSPTEKIQESAKGASSDAATVPKSRLQRLEGEDLKKAAMNPNFKETVESLAGTAKVDGPSKNKFSANSLNISASGTPVPKPRAKRENIASRA